MRQNFTDAILQEVPREALARQEEFASKCSVILRARNIARPTLAFVKTFGCQGNAADSEKLLGMLCSMGAQVAISEEEADIILYNTCAVRENAQARLFGILGELKRLKTNNPNLIIGLCGCMMEQEDVAAKVEKSYKQVDLLLGTQGLYTLPELLYKVLTRKDKKIISNRKEEAILLANPQKIPEGLPVHRTSGVQASLQIMSGCDNFCTYCIVPYVRGREVSRDARKIIAEAKSIIDSGYKEILLLGQNVNSYNKGAENKVSFPDLLEEIDAIPGNFRIRFMTSHPKDCTHELIDTMARCKKVCNSFHLPVQSGCDRILKEMNRKYTSEEYLELISYARNKIPGITFTSDIIVGFPGEAYSEFEETLALCEKVRYQSLFTFIYSARPGTAAAKMSDKIIKEEKRSWLNELIDAQHKISEEDNKKYLEKILLVLAEGVSDSVPGEIFGKSEEGMLVNFVGDKSQIGEFVPVKITNAHRAGLFGIIHNS